NPTVTSLAVQAISLSIGAIAAMSTFLFSVTWNPDLGASHDWDLLSLPGIPLSLLAGALLASAWPQPGQDTSTRYTRTLIYGGSVQGARRAARGPVGIGRRYHYSYAQAPGRT